MTKDEAAYHDHQRTIIKTAEQKQAYRAWLLAIEAKRMVREESIEARKIVVAATERARLATRYYEDAIEEERDAWLKFEITKF